MVSERAIAVVMVDAINLPRQFSHDNVGPAVVVIVLKNYAHAREPSSVLGKSSAGFEAKFGESAVAIVVKQILLHSIVGHKNIGESVAIVIGEGHSQGTSLLGGDAGALTYIRECPVAIVVIQDAGRRGKLFRRDRKSTRLN